MSDQKGQSIVEAIIAIAVIVLALLGFLSQATSNFVIQRISENNLVASNLAQEAIEVARNTRDSNWLKGCFDPDEQQECFYWNSGLSNNQDYSARLLFDSDIPEWGLDFDPDDFADCGEDCLIKIADGVYQMDDGEDTKFSRMLFLYPVCENDNECGGDGICEDGQKCAGEQIGIKVMAEVRWNEPSGEKSFVITDYLYNWR